MCMGPHTAEPKSTQMVLCKSAWFRASRARRRDSGCARTENLEHLLPGMSSSRRDLAIPRRSAYGAHGAAHHRTRKYPNGPIQIGVVSRPACASEQDGLRANGGFRPKFCSAIARSRRDQLFSSRSRDPSISQKSALLVEISRSLAGVRTEPMGPHTAEPESTQMVLYKSA